MTVTDLLWKCRVSSQMLSVLRTIVWIPAANREVGLLIGTLIQLTGWFHQDEGHRYMSLHQLVLDSAPTTSRSGVFRLKALFSEQRARESSDPRSKRDWEALAIEWHMMANLAAGANHDISSN